VFLEASPDGGVVGDVDHDFQLHGNLIVPLAGNAVTGALRRLRP
jgi:hypothetical protein